MNIRTENLTILFVDIAGFTAVTSQQSRVQNARLLDSFNKALLPLIKRFKGRVIKSIGDALLLTFRSPTDAMLCAMALQDAIHEWNLTITEAERIHIRVAASLGEVRVTKNDIFGEPVNVASRIEGIAPADEIYLSEAVYLAMNKAEVPAQEVGFKELAGIPGAIRVYSIPRFATNRLVPEIVTPSLDGGELFYPYGGMHQKFPDVASGFQKNLVKIVTKPPRMMADNARSIIAVLMLICGAFMLYTIYNFVQQNAPLQTAASSTIALASTNPSETQSTTTAVVSPAATEPTVTSDPKPTKKPATVWNVIKAKNAYRAGSISKPTYNNIITNLKINYENRIRQLKLSYKAGRLSRSGYEMQVQAAKHAFRGD